ncbi:hypothetical protein SU69_06860 [Thermosipho melanesiensis]|uniref:Uncharacterized protein n=2 Tax=Thermosipho melanesiensis TaxID=46541 RepID=A6LMQ3_THEM4|nr:hypothetical protein [Thermosipho melanesiensis]ABR31204.1 hypothetical protein Tmel_1356 [Thermosipho melanesiensis BI429]APT74289.1 hypothetical protein BW47_07185 [Thermosipho melanesiensis]OOC36228.1 hypothetical protein SU68_06930 [Thermosipho melanesiensis]OOC37046.1 hypothetical protein SU69_06860 [Thermosipho melanesiensis]OOC37798.1 hypothetical protein SU70_06870 [Thermosipho melanesiensis]
MKKFETLAEIIIKEKSGSWFFWFLLLFIPYANMFSIFFLSNLTLASKIKSKKDKSYYYLPFTKKEIMLYTYLFLILIISSTTLLVEPEKLTFILIFSTAIFSIATLSASFGLDNFAITIIFLILDGILTSFGELNFGSNFNPYLLISPTTQGNVFLSAIFSIALLYFAYKSYTGGESYVKN